MCGQPIKEQSKPTPVHMTHYVNGVQHISLMIPWNDQFFEIVQGRWKGNLVHRWNVKKF